MDLPYQQLLGSQLSVIGWSHPPKTLFPQASGVMTNIPIFLRSFKKILGTPKLSRIIPYGEVKYLKFSTLRQAHHRTPRYRPGPAGPGRSGLGPAASPRRRGEEACVAWMVGWKCWENNDHNGIFLSINPFKMWLELWMDLGPCNRSHYNVIGIFDGHPNVKSVESWDRLDIVTLIKIPIESNGDHCHCQ